MKKENLWKVVLREWIFFITLSALVATSIAFRRMPRYDKSDFEVLFTLFVFLLIVNGLQRSGLFQNFSYRLSRGKFIPQKLFLLTALLSMTVTNDVALIVMVPLTTVLEIENKDLMVVVETLVANASSFLTPFGNPQNMFIYYHYDLRPVDFFKVVYPISLVLILSVLVMTFFVKTEKHVKYQKSSLSKTDVVVYTSLFLLFTLSVFKIFPLWFGLFPVIYASLFDRKAFKIDYFLLATFFSFFGLTDNLTSVMNISLKSPSDVFLISALSSQVISNVPAALLFADLTKNWRALLLGVNVGGFGTLFGSMANLISYRIYAKSKSPGKFLLKFHIYSFSLLFLGILLYFLFYSRQI